jgi:hypothetical protein
MAQITPGAILGCPGGIGSAPLGDFYGNGAPTASTNNLILNAQVGSTYRDVAGGNLWFKSLSGWSQITIP